MVVDLDHDGDANDGDAVIRAIYEHKRRTPGQIGIPQTNGLLTSIVIDSHNR
jgi:hypothetical protein